MNLSIFTYKTDHPFRFKILKKWIQAGLPIKRLKNTIVHEIHVEIIIRLLEAIESNNNLSEKQILEIPYNIGTEIGNQLKELLSIDTENAKSIAKIMDFMHHSMEIKGKTVLGFSNKIAISIWSKCPVYNQIKQSKTKIQYCDIQHEIYTGILFAINPKAKARQITRSETCKHCESKTWIE